MSSPSPRRRTPPSPSPLARPARLAGRYRIERRLGSGSFGTVYEAHDEAANRPVALKILRALPDGPAEKSLMQDEFRALAALDHPQVARAFDFGYSEGENVPFYTREYVAGTPLPPGPPRDVDPAAFLAPILDLLDALEYVHEQGILHLDIHAGNLIVAEDAGRGSVLIDFGLVRSLEAPFTRSGQDRWQSLPPELLSGGALTPRTDVHLAGQLLLYRLTGRTAGQPRLPREISGWGARLTLELERIAEKALQPEPEKRFASAVEFRAALARAIGGKTLRGTRAAEPRSRVLGRDAELAELDRVIDEASAGTPSILWWIARAGLGKSRLLAEAKLRSQLRGLATVEVSFAAAAEKEPALAGALRGAHAGRREQLAWLEPLSSGFGGTSSDRALRAAEAYFRVRERPMVLLLDDLDEADHESRLLVEALIAEAVRRRDGRIEGRGLGILLTTSRRLSLPIEGRKSRPGARVRTLAPLGAVPARQLFLALAGSLMPPASLVREAIARGRGSPLRLRQIAAAIREEWRHRAAIPPSATLPDAVPGHGRFHEWARLSRMEREALEALGVLGRPATREEVAVALARPQAAVTRALRRLASFEVVAWSGTGRGRRCRLVGSEATEIVAGLPRRQVAAVHERLIAFLRERPAPGGVDRENLSRHLLAAGCREHAFRTAREAARLLREAGLADRAVRLLEDIAAVERRRARRLELAEAMSAILEEVGDHLKGVQVLAPAWGAGRKAARGAARVRLGRRLGVHYHRAGQPLRALEVFEEACRLADPRRDKEELILIDSELAEIHIFQGMLDAAATACRAGLERIATLSGAGAFRGRMEVMLRASLGHIALRRLALGGARKELERALELSRKHGTLGDRAAIQHNLGVTENYASDFARARRHFLEAERLLVRAGERNNLLKISTNLLLIAAKLGDRRAVEDHRERIGDLLRHHPGRRLECFAAYSDGLAAFLLGHCEDATGSLAKATDLARELGDVALQSFAELALAECFLVTGRYARSAKLLRALARRPHGAVLPPLESMAHARLYFLEALLGGRRRAESARNRLASLPPGEILYAELWNDLWVAAGDLALGGDPSEVLERTRKGFERLGVSVGERLARLGLLLAALGSGDASRIAARLSAGKSAPPQRFLEIAEPVADAAAALALDDPERAEKLLAATSSAIVGSSFLEVDWMLELLRARLAARRGELEDARRHLHRCLQLRDILAQLVPAEARGRFGAHRRFDELRRLEGRIGPAAAPKHSTPRLHRSTGFENIVGRSAPMVSAYQVIERLRDQEIPVLVTGETGTGKELFARAIHAHSPRRERPLRVVHSACLPVELFESELFGHVAGAFTGADRDRAGLLEDAAGGTLLLDEVGQLPLESQAKLLGVLDSGTIRKLGSVSPRRADVRFLATTALDLRGAVETGRFRRDLYHRLAGVVIHVPPLRERLDDIPDLVRHFLERHGRRLDRPASSMDAEALELLQRHAWPGNVRELEVLLLRALVQLPHPDRIRAADIEPLLGPGGHRPAGFGRDLLQQPLGERRRELEREYLTRLFLETRGDLRAMMRALGVKSSKLYGWLRALGLDVRALRRRLE